MNLSVKKPRRLEGIITPPASKSHTIRALLLALLCRGTSRITHPLTSDDTEAAIEICRGLGAHVEHTDNAILVTGQGLPIQPAAAKLFSRNSGITTKFSLPILGLREDTASAIFLDAGEQMRKRPILPLVEALNSLGMYIEPASVQSVFPLRVTGSLKGGQAEVDGESSQYISALLMILPLVPENSVITVRNLQERPYVGMTLSWLDRLGIRYEHEERGRTDIFRIPGRQIYEPFESTVPADFSSASYIIAAAAALPGTVTVKGLDMQDPQSDKGLIAILRDMGADIAETGEGLTVRGGRQLRGIEIDANDIPDMLPTLAVIATQAAGETRIVNVAHARIKETDRIRSLYEGLKALGADIDELPDGLSVRKSSLHGAEVKGYGDHRTVMALSVAGMLADGETVIDTAEAVAKTYPGFVEDMNILGAGLHQSGMYSLNS